MYTRQAIQGRHSKLTVLCGCLAACLTSSLAAGDAILLQLARRPPHGVVAVRVNLSQLAKHYPLPAQRPLGFRASSDMSDERVPVQFIPDAVDRSSSSETGLLLLRVPPGAGKSIRLEPHALDPTPAESLDAKIVRPDTTIAHRPGAQGGLPARFVFHQSQHVFSEFNWNDRVYHPDQGGFLLRHDAHAQTRVVARGPLCTVVETTASYMRPDGERPESQPTARYRWHYLHDVPLVLVTAAMHQQVPFSWSELHFLELNFPGQDFPQYVGDTGADPKRLRGDGSTHSFSQWGALLQSNDAIGMFGCGEVKIHDGRGGYGTYLHAAARRAWMPWDSTTAAFAAWLWIGNTGQPAETIRAWQNAIPDRVPAFVTLRSVQSAIQRMKRSADQASDPAARRDQRWRVAQAEQLAAQGELDVVQRLLAGELPRGWNVLPAGDLCLTVNATDDGLQLVSLYDTRDAHEYLAFQSAPLFSVTLRDAQTGDEKTLSAAEGWDRVEVSDRTDGRLRIRWSQPLSAELSAMAVDADIRLDAKAHAIRWRLKVQPPDEPWALWNVRFPHLTIAPPGKMPVLLYPRGAGALNRDAWNEPFQFQGTYPNGWVTMQFLAAYDEARGRGLYWGLHDPLAATKDLKARSSGSHASGVVASVDHPPAGMGRPGTKFSLSGEAVWRLFDGDWFDAAVIYRDWVRGHATWYPRLTAEGRADTPLWMRRLPVWLMTGGTGSECVERVERFARFMQLPVGFHWYRWHKIPFDNDYPHYFPAHDDFAKGVRRLRESNVFVMPYINGRLWDTRDRGMEDFQFTRRALAAATRQASGEPYVEMYGSKERDGSRVRLAVMCPACKLWQDTVHSIVTRLFDPHSVAGVYIDQVAAASPKLCLDTRHPHPLGGGHWWVDSYGEMLDRIRRDMPPGRMLTTECNAEPYVKWFDGYLTWHWQYDGQVAAFPAVYGGAIQMFGRAYRGGPTRDLALRMKAGQQLVYGEQLGWFSPDVIDDAENARFLRDLVQLRWLLRRYFYAGEMARPPELEGEIPTVTADWQWQGTWPVTTSALQRGAWALPRENKTVFLFVNVSDDELQCVWRFEPDGYGMQGEELTLCRRVSGETSEPQKFQRRMEQTLRLPARSVQAWEVRCER